MDSLEIRLIQETNVVDCDPMGMVVFQILDDFVCITLPPVTCSTGCIGYTAKVPAVKVGACVLTSIMKLEFCKRRLRRTSSFHVPISAPCIGIDGVHASRNCFRSKPNLIFIVPRKRNKVKLESLVSIIVLALKKGTTYVTAVRSGSYRSN